MAEVDAGQEDTWVALTGDPLTIGAAADWAARPDCGAVVVFAGTVRDRSAGRPGVERLEYEAYESQVEPRLEAIVEEARQHWPTLGRVALLHRTGVLGVGDAAVVVAASAPHRPECFAAARFCIDTVKATVPIWKREAWAGGEDWGRCDQEADDAVPLGAVAGREVGRDH